jgi:V8-like Glu-specific endopeptidase
MKSSSTAKPGLITAWKQRQARGQALLDTRPRPAFDFKGFEQPNETGLEAIIGKDDSVIVTDTANAPWRPLVCLRIYAPGEDLVGSGILIRPDVILTAAHNVYRLGSKSYATSIVAHVGKTQTGVAGAEAYAKRVQCPPEYVNSSGPNDSNRYPYDFALIFLNTDALGRWTKPEHIPDLPGQIPMSDLDMRSSQLTIAGYPCYPNAPVVLRKCNGSVINLAGTGVYYDMDSMPGQSGGPVFRYNEATRKLAFVGVHTTGFEAENRARRYDAMMQKSLNAWLASGAAGKAIA